MAHPAPEEKSSCWSPGTLLLTASAVAAVAVGAAPFVLPALGIGGYESDLAFNLCTSDGPTGLAGWSANLLSYVPYVGDTLAQGGIWNGIAGGAIGLGGAWIGNRMQESGSDCTVKWGKALKIAALVTTALVALPALLPAISMGLNFLSFTLGNPASEISQAVVGFSTDVIGKLGTTGVMGAGAGGAAFSSLLIPHLLTCGVGGALAAQSVYHSMHHGAGRGEMIADTRDTQLATAPAQQFQDFVARERLKRQYGLADNEMGQAAAR